MKADSLKEKYIKIPACHEIGENGPTYLGFYLPVVIGAKTTKKDVETSIFYLFNVECMSVHTKMRFSF